MERHSPPYHVTWLVASPVCVVRSDAVRRRRLGCPPAILAHCVWSGLGDCSGLGLSKCVLGRDEEALHGDSGVAGKVVGYEWPMLAAVERPGVAMGQETVE